MNVFAAYKFNNLVKRPFEAWVIDEKQLKQSINHCQEELIELMDALTLAKRAMEKHNHPEAAKQLTLAVDAVLDLRYVATNVAYSIGVPPETLQHAAVEVHMANMRKLPPVFDPAGKVLKPANWRGPDHTAVELGFLHKLGQ